MNTRGLGQSPSDPPQVLDYARPMRRPVGRFERWLAWPLPLWSAIILAPGYAPFRRDHDDSFLAAAIAVEVLVGVVCLATHQRALACYCFAFPVALLILGEAMRFRW
jgi:hypothetical protein